MYTMFYLIVIFYAQRTSLLHDYIFFRLVKNFVIQVIFLFLSWRNGPLIGWWLSRLSIQRIICVFPGARAAFPWRILEGSVLCWIRVFLWGKLNDSRLLLQASFQRRLDWRGELNVMVDEADLFLSRFKPIVSTNKHFRSSSLAPLRHSLPRILDTANRRDR